MAGRCEYIVSGGGIGVDSLIVNEIPTGIVNSINTDFSIANDPILDTVTVYLNGLLQTPGTGKDYTISGKDINFSKAPRSNSEILVSYAKQIVT